jgi:hypothetical protein
MVWPHEPARLQQFFDHFNSVRPTIKFTVEVETNNTLPFLDVLVIKRGPGLITKVYRKPTHTGRYLHFKSKHPHSLVNRAKVICQNQKDFNNEIKTIRHNLMISEYPKEFVDSVMKPAVRNHPTSDKVYKGTVFIPYVRGISEKFRCIGNRLSLSLRTG